MIFAVKKRGRSLAPSCSIPKAFPSSFQVALIRRLFAAPPLYFGSSALICGNSEAKLESLLIASLISCWPWLF